MNNNDNRNPYGLPPGAPPPPEQGYAPPQGQQAAYGPPSGYGPMQPYTQQPMQPGYGPQSYGHGQPMGYGAPAPINIVVQNTANAGYGYGGVVRVSNKSKGTAAVLAIFLGGLGAHKFYLGQPVMGILYLLMSWTFLPAIAGFIEGISYLVTSDHAFDMKYNARLT